MKNTFLLFLLAGFFCLAICEHGKHPEKNNHTKHHMSKSRFSSLTKHGFKETKRASETIEVDLKDRKIKGTVNQTQTTQKQYYQFRGIAYAKPPVDELRFEPPQAYKWEGTYDATYHRNICTQIPFPNVLDIEGAEDCLYLNVYTPQTSASSSLSVLVWIHGGGFFSGSGNYEKYAPDNFIDQGLVVVTLNYRLGVFGFLTTGDNVVPGNMGLKDQVLALKWVQENIGYFGGNPENVTIMGESAGGASITYLVQSPATKGLFQRAIAHSGNSLCPWSLSRTGVANFQLLTSKAANNGMNATNVEGLKKVDYKTLKRASVSSMNELLLLDPLNGLVYTPVVEPPNPSEVFSTKSYEQLSSCNLKSVPLIIGYNSAEIGGVESNNEINILIRLLQVYLTKVNLNSRNLVPLDMNVNNTQDKNKLGNEIKDTYKGVGKPIVGREATNKYLTDDMFIRPTLQYSKLYSGCGQNVFQYRFSYAQNTTAGVGHEEELQYFFYTKKVQGEQNLKFSSDVVKIWANFIKTGNPTPDAAEFNVTWNPSTKDNNYSYLDIGQEFEEHNQETNPDKSYLDKWTNWYDTYGHRPHDTY